MTVKQLADTWGISAHRVWTFIQQGRLDPWVKTIMVNGKPHYELDPQAVDHRPTDRRKKETK